MTRFRFDQQKIMFAVVGTGPSHNPAPGAARGEIRGSQICAFLCAEYSQSRPAHCRERYVAPDHL